MPYCEMLGAAEARTTLKNKQSLSRDTNITQ